MKTWRERKALYEIHEVTRKSHEVYHFLASGDEISAYCKGKNEMNGYIEGLGGDRSYCCWAVLMVA